MTVGDRQSASLVFFIRFDVVGDVQGPEGLQGELLKDFVKRQATWLLWPYAREFAQSLSVRLGLNPILLLTLQVGMASSPPSERADADAPEESVEGRSEG